MRTHAQGRRMPSGLPPGPHHWPVSHFIGENCLFLAVARPLGLRAIAKENFAHSLPSSRLFCKIVNPQKDCIDHNFNREGLV